MIIQLFNQSVVALNLFNVPLFDFNPIFRYLHIVSFLQRIADSLVLLLNSGADKEPEIIEQVWTGNPLEIFVVKLLFFIVYQMNSKLGLCYADFHILVVYYDVSAEVSCKRHSSCSQVSNSILLIFFVYEISSVSVNTCKI